MKIFNPGSGGAGFIKGTAIGILITPGVILITGLTSRTAIPPAPSLVALDDNESLLLYRASRSGGRVTGFTASNVGHGFAFTDDWTANFTGNSRADLLERNSAGDLLLYPFENGVFTGTGNKVGHGFAFANYFAADRDADGKADLIVQKADGEFLHYPFKNGGFQGSGAAIGNGPAITRSFAGNW